jgi:predicted O-methyltransferase YrrM
MKHDYKFTSDWFLNNLATWEYYLKEFKNQPNLHFIEIGSYEGRSAVWLLENILTDPTSKITCIDLFDGRVEDNNMENDPNLNPDYEDHFHYNMKPFQNKVSTYKGWSAPILRKFPYEKTFDLAYIDGGHTAYGTLEDAILIHPLIKNNGLIIFDDYGWKDPADLSPQNSPELAINVFYNVFENQYDVIHQGWQVILRKK